MHEYSLLEGVIDTILKELKKPEASSQGEVAEVILKVGALAVHSEAATRTAFEVLTRGTPLEKSRLNLTILPVTLACPKCGYQGPLPEGSADPHDPAPLAACPNCGAISPVIGDRGVTSIELVFED